MKTKYLLIALSLVTLVGCGKEVEITPDNIPDVILTPPITEDTTIDTEVEERVDKQLKELQITDRTKIMVDEKNMDTFNKKETSTDNPSEEVVEENKLLSRFKENMANISFPLNYRVVGTAEVSADKTVNISVARMGTGSAYTCYNYGNILLEQFIVDDRLNYSDKYVSYKCDGFTANGRLKTDVASDMITFDDFRVAEISNVLKVGNNYKVDGSFIVGSTQVDGTITVGDNMNVYNLEFIKNGIIYELKIQTVLKMPKEQADFNVTDLTDEENATYCKYAANILKTEEVSTEDTSGDEIPTEGLVDTKESVDVKLDEFGNIVQIIVTKIYTYDNGDVINQIIVKDKDGSVISSDIKKQDNPQEIETVDEEEAYLSSIELKPTFALDENISAAELTESLKTYFVDNVVYEIVDIGDPTKFAVDFMFMGTLTKEEVESKVSKFAEENYTTVVEWR